jgi:heterodisulfide reductase subunit A
MAHSPRSLGETIVQAEAAAQMAYKHLCKGEMHTSLAVSKVHDALCTRCQICVEACPYDARAFDVDEDRITVDSATCQACGMCAVACPSDATEVMGWNAKQMMAVIDARLTDSRPAMAGS